MGTNALQPSDEQPSDEQPGQRSQSPRSLPKLYLGCPVWACSAWTGSLYRSSSRDSWLRDYSSVFQTVEGNSTFYALPSREVVQKWAEQTHPGFRFAFKFPRQITHDGQLAGVEEETDQFLALLEILHHARRLGPSFLQLPPFFDRTQFDTLARYLEALPREYPYAVEVRHADYFDEGEIESRLDGLLRERGIDRVLFDSRALYSRPPADEVERVSQSRKPKSPLRYTVTGRHPFVRFVGRNRIEEAQAWIDEWSPHIAGWLRAGLEPFVFTHAPDDAFAPVLAETFHQAIQREFPELPDLAPWPGRQVPKQMELF